MHARILNPLIFATMATIACGVLPVRASATHLVYNAYMPPGHLVSTSGVVPWLAEIERRTEGSVTFDFHSGGTLASGKTTLNAIRSGVIDAGAVVDLYTPADLPISTMLSDLFLYGEDPRVMAAAMNETVLLDCERCRDDYLEENVRPLGFTSTPAYLLQCKKPITTVAQVSGHKIRATGAMGVLAASLGGTPVNITNAEIYEAMQRGQVDCFLGPGAWLGEYALAEVTGYVTDLPMGTYHGQLPFNLREESWKALGLSEKRAVLESLPRAIRSVVEAYVAQEANVKAEASGRGLEWVQPDTGMQQALAEARVNELSRVADLARKRGVEDPEQIISIFLENVRKWREIVAGTAGDFDVYESALRREIFDKLSLE